MIARARRVLAVSLGGVVLLLASPASAKGPIDADLVISGGDLEHEIRVPAAALNDLQWMAGFSAASYIASPPPVPIPLLMYRIDFYEPGGSELSFSYDYSPGADGKPSMVRHPDCVHSPRCWLGGLHPDFDQFLRANLAGVSPALSGIPGPPVLEPFISLAFLLGVLWLVRRPPIRKRLARLAY